MSAIRVLLLPLALLPGVLQAEPIPVRTESLGKVLTEQVYSAPATVRPFNRPQLSAEVTGQILSMPVRVGDEVKAGQLLVELDCRVHRQREKTAIAATVRSRAQVKFAEAQLKRAQDLKAKRSISEELLQQRQTELDGMRADYAAQLAQREMAEIDVQRCRIDAPFDALVAQRLGSEGSLANPGTPLLELVQTSKLEVSAELRGNQAQTLSNADTPSFHYQGDRYDLALRALPPLIDERTRTREARLTFHDRSAPVGAAGRLQWTSQTRLLPAHYLVRRNGHLGVFVEKQGKAKFIVLPRAIEGQPTEVDIPDDAKLITDGRQRLSEGDTIAAEPGQTDS